MWGDTPAIGQRFILQSDLIEVVGVAEDGKYHNLQEPPQPVVYLPLSQNEQSSMIFVVRSRRAHDERTEVAAALERTLGGLEPDAQITVQSWRDAMAGPLFPARAATVALGVLGLLAAMLAVTGIFGMAAYNVSRRMKELGIRVALGARTGNIMSAAVGRPIVLLGIGSFGGVAARHLRAAGGWDRSFIRRIRGIPWSWAARCWRWRCWAWQRPLLPALRALAVDPSKLMREE